MEKGKLLGIRVAGSVEGLGDKVLNALGEFSGLSLLAVNREYGNMIPI